MASSLLVVCAKEQERVVGIRKGDANNWPFKGNIVGITVLCDRLQEMSGLWC